MSYLTCKKKHIFSIQLKLMALELQNQFLIHFRHHILLKVLKFEGFLKLGEVNQL